MPLTPEMRRAGVTPKLMKTTQKMKCPRCGLEFSLFQSRAIACTGCPKATLSCELARCLRCDLEFPIHGPVVPTALGQRNVSNYMSDIVANYYRSVGKNPKR
jgi:transcription elongation factor Elf1